MDKQTNSHNAALQPAALLHYIKKQEYTRKKKLLLKYIIQHICMSVCTRTLVGFFFFFFEYTFIYKTSYKIKAKNLANRKIDEEFY